MKKGNGRKKIEMEKIQSETKLQVTFSKRRAGVFKKASEISTLCAAETAVLIFSPANKPHSFAYPDLKTVSMRFLRHHISETTENIHHQRENLSQQTLDLNHLQRRLELEQKRAQELETQLLMCRPNLDNLDYTKLVRLQEALHQFKNRFEIRSLLGLASSSKRYEGPSFAVSGNVAYAPIIGYSTILIPYSSMSPTHSDQN